MDILMQILCGRRDPTDAFFIYGVVALFGILNLYVFIKYVPQNSDLLATAV
jgi:hypothetical protein